MARSGSDHHKMIREADARRAAREPIVNAKKRKAAAQLAAARAAKAVKHA